MERINEVADASDTPRRTFLGPFLRNGPLYFRTTCR